MNLFYFFGNLVPNYSFVYLLLLLSIYYFFICHCFLISFPPAASSFILQQFSQYGNIMKSVVSFAEVAVSMTFRSSQGSKTNPFKSI